MSLFRRLMKRISQPAATRCGSRPHKRHICFEPLEERRMLAAVPTNFNVTNDSSGGPVIEIRWDLMQGATGYEIERSINGIDQWKNIGIEFSANDNFFSNPYFRSYYFRIQSVEEPQSGPTIYSDWTEPDDSDARPFNNPEDRTVKVSAIAHSQIDVPLIAATIELRWPEELAYRDADYTISRKEKDELSFTQVASLTWDGQNPITGWTDENLGSKTAYEYKVQRHRKEDDSVPPNFYFTSANTGTGYVYAGVDVPLDDPDSTIESPGTVMLVIDITLTGMVPDEMDRLEDDLRAEGWDVLKIYVSPHDDLNPQSAENLNNIEYKRNEIIYAYEDPNVDLKAVLLLGHVPIPMSGWNSPDGHGARPMPADVYYGDMDGVWSDDTDHCLATAVCGPLLPEISNRRPRWTTLSLAI